jgi:serine/threonine protein kinase
MLTGQLPLPEVETDDPLKKMLKRGINSIKPLSEQRHAPDPELTEIIEKMMKVDLRQRYNTMAEVCDDLEQYLERQSARALGLPLPVKAKPKPKATDTGVTADSEEDSFMATFSDLRGGTSSTEQELAPALSAFDDGYHDSATHEEMDPTRRSS